MAKMWNPWRGCHRISEGCKNCYIHIGDARKEIDTNNIILTDSFDLPIKKKKNGEYKIKSGELIYLCFSSDFLLEEADEWRMQCFEMIKERSDLRFLFLTKRIERMRDHLPSDWGEGYDNVTVGLSLSNQRDVDRLLPVFKQLPIKHKNIILQPMIEKIDISNYLDDIQLVVVGGEYGPQARELHYEWVLDVRKQCISANIPFEFRQCGTFTIKDGKTFKLNYKELSVQAKKADINWKPQHK